MTFAISVASRDSGADEPPEGLYRDTYFNSTYWTSGIERLLTIDAVGYNRLDSLSMLLMPDYDVRMVLVNDGKYGGSGGYIAVASTHPSSAEIMVHELGHSFGGLADEYTDAYPGWIPREFPNATQVTQRSLIAWNSWILTPTPVPTPVTYLQSVGLFEGAEYQTTGWYRPKYDCKMNHLGVPFCKVCQEALVKRIGSLSDVPLLPNPTLVQPVNFATKVNASNAVFQWDSVATVTCYRLQIATDSLFTDIKVDTLYVNFTRTVSSLNSDTKYFWRVRAIKPGMLGDYSAIYGFTTGPPLPITLASFVCIPTGLNAVMLKWETISEINNYGFEIQKSATGQANYCSLPGSFIPGHGTTLLRHSYSYTDASADARESYYRLKQIDLDGSLHRRDQTGRHERDNRDRVQPVAELSQPLQSINHDPLCCLLPFACDARCLQHTWPASSSARRRGTGSRLPRGEVGGQRSCLRGLLLSNTRGELRADEEAAIIAIFAHYVGHTWR